MPDIILYGEKEAHDVPEMVLALNELERVSFIYQKETTADRPFLPCVEYDGEQYSPLEFFKLIKQVET